MPILPLLLLLPLPVALFALLPQVCPVHLTQVLYKHMVGQPVDCGDLACLDPMLARNLEQVGTAHAEGPHPYTHPTYLPIQ